MDRVLFRKYLVTTVNNLSHKRSKAMQLSSAPPVESKDSKTASIQNEVKMVIWDLDETFWNGTLAESGIEFIQSNAAIVRTLAARGIISSIVSKKSF